MSDDLDEPEFSGWDIVMPFVTVASEGGPHDDAAYVCGWECGALDAKLAHLALAGGDSLRATVHSENVPQVDLIAMKHGYRVEADSEVSEYVAGWSPLHLTRMDPEPNAPEAPERASE